MNIPECPFRPARWLVTEFVRPFNVAIQAQSIALRKPGASNDDYIKACADYVRDFFTYPQEKNGEPSAGLLFRRYDRGWAVKRYFYNQEMDYAWGFPNETLKIKQGICVDTALLMTSLLIAGGIPAKCALGAIVNAKTNEVAGYHAWSIFTYRGKPSCGETTIHFKAETITEQASIYRIDNKNSDWMNTNGIFYREEAEFDNVGYDATGLLGAEMVCLMGLPAQRVQCYGLNDTLERVYMKRKAMAKEWRKSEAIKHQLLSLAYKGGGG
jgi:hypothetical protein